ncbi:hypothetical protein BHM03_00051190 [Ensete ventricosum]|nr:hypothetical protein BHM03_00051190 [Ensete ventricosum]
MALFTSMSSTPFFIVSITLLLIFPGALLWELARLEAASGWRAVRVVADVAAGVEEWLAAAIWEESKAGAHLKATAAVLQRGAVVAAREDGNDWKRLDSSRGKRGTEVASGGRGGQGRGQRRCATAAAGKEERKITAVAIVGGKAVGSRGDWRRMAAASAMGVGGRRRQSVQRRATKGWPVAIVVGRHGRKAAMEEKERWWPMVEAGDEEGLGYNRGDCGRGKKRQQGLARKRKWGSSVVVSAVETVGNRGQ